ncbi:hypothetical protein HY637_03930 [Candidatus Woesearchaeota archaeon]|nr:hypothetical protein [Candidatus Woesearchaeota archaeon]
MLGKKGVESEDANRIISSFQNLSKEEKIELISRFIDELKRIHEVSEQELLHKKEAMIPVGVFGNDALSSLEAIVKFMRENLKMRFSKIAKSLNRSNKTIWATYSKASKKMPSSFDNVSRQIIIPSSAISNRSYSTLESVVGFVKDLDYSNHEVAEMLHLDDRTIWTVWDRVKKKRGMKLEQ